MGLMDDFLQSLGNQVAQRLSEPARDRMAGLMAVRSVTQGQELDIYDRIRLSRYILTGSEEEPEVIIARNASGETTVAYVEEAQDAEPQRRFPYDHGDALVLGPGVFAGTPHGDPQRPRADYEGTVINWDGVNFVPQGEVQPLTGVVGPDPEFEAALAEEETSVNTEAEPAPSAGTHWRGRRGR